jgi:hypothetical protein
MMIISYLHDLSASYKARFPFVFELCHIFSWSSVHRDTKRAEKKGVLACWERRFLNPLGRSMEGEGLLRDFEIPICEMRFESVCGYLSDLRCTVTSLFYVFTLVAFAWDLSKDIIHTLQMSYRFSA